MAISKKTSKAERQQAIDALKQAAGSMRQPNSASKLVEQLLTESEQITIGRRLLIAQMLMSGKTQAEIRAELSVSPNTFTRTKHWLSKAVPEYGKAVELEEKERKEKAEKRARSSRRYEGAQPFTLGDLKQRYPGHFLLFNLVDEILKRRS